MRDVLRKRVRQQVERLVEDMTELAVCRVEAELERMGEAFQVALSAFASEVTSADSDGRDHDPVPRVRRSSRRGLHQNARPEPVGGLDAAEPAQASDARCPEGERAARLVGQTPGLLTATLGPELATMLGEGSSSLAMATHVAERVASVPEQVPLVVDRDVKPHKIPDSANSRSCGCAARGPHRRGCSMPNVSASPRSHDGEETSPVAPITKQDRFARIEAAAAARRAGLGGEG